MSAGRYRKPTELKKLQGTARQDRINPNQPQFTKLTSLPAAPDYLNDYGQQEWHTVTTELQALQMLTRVDLYLLAAYCHEVARYWRAQEKLDLLGEVIDSPKGTPMTNPWLFVANGALDRALKLATLFGFLPSARQRLRTSRPGEEDELDAYLNRKKRRGNP